jgi:mechanosensitive ion channel-like protein
VPIESAAVFGLPMWAGRLVLVGAILAASVVLLSVIGWIVPRLVARAGSSGHARVRQRKTAVSALATSLRYIVLVAAVVAIAFVLAGGGGLAAVGSGALVVVVVGFASQRLLVDIIAGFFILFEDQYGVGDVVRLEPSGYTGEVETLGLRATVLIGSGRERLIVPNGQITAVRLIPGGRRRHRLELLTREPDQVALAVTEVSSAMTGAGGPWAAVPRVTRREQGDGLWRLVVVVDVDAAREDATRWLAEAIETRTGDLLVVPPLRSIDAGFA